MREIDEVLGVLGELIEIEPGWELAVEAAIGGVLASVVVEYVAAARAALERLGTSEAPGSILPPIVQVTMQRNQKSPCLT